MTDRSYQAVRRTLLPLTQKWLRLCGAGWDHVHLNWVDRYFSEDVDGHPANCYAFCSANWQYLQASITFSCEQIWETFFDHETNKVRRDRLDELEELIIHEIMHILVNEMRDYDRGNHHGTVGHEERVVTRLARAMVYTKREFQRCR